MRTVISVIKGKANGTKSILQRIHWKNQGRNGRRPGEQNVNLQTMLEKDTLKNEYSGFHFTVCSDNGNCTISDSVLLTLECQIDVP